MRQPLAYLAVTGRGLNEGVELKRQKKVILQRGFEIVRFFEEDRSEAIKRVGVRPAFRGLIKALFAGEGDCVVLECIDRLDSSLEAQEAVSAFLDRAGFEVVCCRTTGQDALEQKTRGLIKTSILAFDECQKDLFNARLSGLRQNKKNHKRVGTKPYGTYPGERDVINRMRSLQERGLGFSAIALTLTVDGVLSRRGKDWYGTTVSNILRRPMHT